MLTGIVSIVPLEVPCWGFTPYVQAHSLPNTVNKRCATGSESTNQHLATSSKPQSVSNASHESRAHGSGVDVEHPNVPFRLTSDSISKAQFLKPEDIYGWSSKRRHEAA